VLELGGGHIGAELLLGLDLAALRETDSFSTSITRKISNIRDKEEAT
jgi:hypothetical protein